MPSNNPKPTFNIFGPATRCDVKVGYISTTRGYVDNVGVYEANKYAKLDPGTVFIFKTREVIKYLTINEVNKLISNDLTPQTKTCLGPQLNLENPTPHIDFFGGGGVGVQANPIIGSDGSLMAVDVVEKGYGYQYPPQVKIRDDLNIGAGTLLKSKLCKDDKTYIVYDKEEDYEEYDLTSCRGVDLNDYGTRRNIHGKPVGIWDPTIYANLSKDPIRAEIYEYQKYLARGLKPWWTTRKQIPLSITSDVSTNRTKHDVKHWYWGGTRNVHPDGRVIETYHNNFMNNYAISPVPPSNVPGSDYAGILFTYIWEEDFPYDGEYIFRGMRDNEAKLYIDNVYVPNVTNPGNSSSLTNYDAGSGVMGSGGVPAKIKQTMTAGVHQIRVDLLNNPIIENIISQPAGTNDVTFKITTSAQYGNIFKMPQLGIDLKKDFDGPQLDETFTKTLEPGKVYDVIIHSPETKSKHGGVRLRTQGENVLQCEEAKDHDWIDVVCSASQGRFINLPKGSSGGSGENSNNIVYGKLNKSNDSITVTSGGKRIELKDSKGDDTNVSFTIDSGNATFSSDGRSIKGTGKVKINLTYDDNPNYADEAVRTIKIRNVVWTKEKKHKGSETKVVDLGSSRSSGGGGGKEARCQFVIDGPPPPPP